MVLDSSYFFLDKLRFYSFLTTIFNMKPEVVEYLLDYYLKQKQHSTCYDDVDGVFYTSRVVAEAGSYEAGEPGFNFAERYSELQSLYPQLSHPHQPYHAPLNNDQRELAERFGRQLSNMSNEFEMEVTGRRLVSVVVGDCEFKFQKRLFARLTHENVSLKIVRSGNTNEESTFAWQTKDDTAVAGIDYVKSSGNIHFDVGETEKVIEIPLLKDHKDSFSTFKVEIDFGLVDDISRNYVSVDISELENVPPEEKSVMERIIDCQYPTFQRVTTYLSQNVTTNTLKTALLCLSGNAIDLKHEFQVAFSLMEFALQHSFRIDYAKNLLFQHFRSAPEIGTLVADGSESEDADDSGESKDADNSEESENEEVD